jgi:hypothetical protein
MMTSSRLSLCFISSLIVCGERRLAVVFLRIHLFFEPVARRMGLGNFEKDIALSDAAIGLALIP